ncbi:MAG: hypothetical protein KAS32_19440 [Candidatus Peribacteraceae bacterium]|nr:hypothetical protein [Candidatus Peribacteraceae bacterium]
MNNYICNLDVKVKSTTSGRETIGYFKARKEIELPFIPFIGLVLDSSDIDSPVFPIQYIEYDLVTKKFFCVIRSMSFNWDTMKVNEIRGKMVRTKWEIYESEGVG